MRWILPLLLLGGAVAALAQSDTSGTTRVWTQVQPATRTAPTFDAGDGMSLRDVGGYRVIVCGALLSDGGFNDVISGAVEAYLYDNDIAAAGGTPWQRGGSALDLDLSDAVGKDCLVSPDFKVSVPSGRVLYRTNTAVADAGTTFRVQIKAWTRRPEAR